MEQFGSSHSECKYREQFQEWSVQRLKQSRMGFFEDWCPTNPMAAQVLQQDPHQVNNQVNIRLWFISRASSTLLCEYATYKGVVSLFCVHGVECPADFTYIASVNGCYKLVTRNLEWSVAGIECRRLHKDAHLLVINDAQEQSAVAGMLASTSRQCLFHTFSGWYELYT